MKISCSGCTENEPDYMPPPIGNGDLSLFVDFRGSQFPHRRFDMLPEIRRAGYRFDSPGFPLIPFGHFEAESEGAGPVTGFEQTLDTATGIVTSCCRHADGGVIESTVFCSLDANIIALRYRLSGGAEKRPFHFRYFWDPPRTRLRALPGAPIKLEYDIDGFRRYRGRVAIFTGEMTPEKNFDGCVRLCGGGTEFTCLLCFDDAAPGSFDQLRLRTEQAWRSYWDESFLEVPERKFMEVCSISAYHLRISSTRWSIPTGIYDSHWHGRYFGFDEYFIFMGAIRSGHLAMAKKIPLFRAATLESARYRAARFSKFDEGAARYSWESCEDGAEGSPPGFWYEHIFHMSNIALECAEFYRFSGDRTYLEEDGWPVIRACVKFFLDGVLGFSREGRLIVNNCTDLERLGPFRSNPFMTTCGVIAALEEAAWCAEELGRERDLAAECRRVAAELRISLPHDGRRYLPYPGCTVPSIAVLAGIYPYAVLPDNDPLALEALRTFRESIELAGNMYETGRSICAWYAGWLAIAEIRTGNSRAAYETLRCAAEDTGNFSQLFEIREKGMRPYFTTAEGVFLHAVTELLLRITSERILIAPALPAEWRSFAFALPLPFGGRLRVSVENGKLTRLDRRAGTGMELPLSGLERFERISDVIIK